jgi:hypothetical protein
VRRALALLEGIRNGQTLPALLGYRFERGLHEGHAGVEVDRFIYPLRQVFPLVANQLKSTRPDNPVDITLLEARNVVDGVKLVTRARTPGYLRYPFGFPIGNEPGQLPSANDDEQRAINAEVDALLDLYDALGDLVLAESVYQVVQGNFERAAANTTALNRGGHPPEIEVVRTPRRGDISLMHRVALHLDPKVEENASRGGVQPTPRSRAEASLNSWLYDRLPAPEVVVVKVSYSTPAHPTPRSVEISQRDLGLQPIDLLYVANLDLDQAMAELDDRIVQLVRYGTPAAPTPVGGSHPGVDVEIEYTRVVPGKVTFFELAALIRALRTLLLKSRPIGPSDMIMPLETSSVGAGDAVWDEDDLERRVKNAIEARGGLAERRDALRALVTDVSDLDDYARQVTDELLAVALFGLPQTGIGHIHGDIRAIYDAVFAKLQELVTRWRDRASEYTTLMATWDTLTSDAERFAMLKQAERLIVVDLTSPIPSDPNKYRAVIEAEKKQFDRDLARFVELLTWTGTRLIDFLAAVAAAAPSVMVHDLIPFDISDQQRAATTLRERIVAQVERVAADLTTRIDAATTAVTAAATLTGEARIQALLAAARYVLGDEILLVPRFTLAPDRGGEIVNAWRGSAELLADLIAAGRRAPVDDWLYGLARVREKLGAWENVIVLAEGFGAEPIGLRPLQLPFVAGDRWTALEFDATRAGRHDRLLYTAHFAVDFDPTALQCGLLLDEWPELVPDTEVVSGVAFHFDRPNAEPPQVLLLAVPPERRGHWDWSDLVATLEDTLEAAKTRAVEPAHIDKDKSAYAQFLPATMMAVTLYWLTISTNLGLNRGVYQTIGDE